MLMFSLLHSYNPSPVLTTIGPFTIYWYGLFYTVSIALGYWLVASTLKQILSTHYPLPTTHSAALGLYGSTALRLTARLPEFSFGLVVSGLIGARIYHVLNEWSYYWAHPLQVFAVWNGGLAIHGALLGGVIYLWFYAHRQFTTHYPLPTTHSFLWLLDLLSPAVLLGQAIGRWGNYFNQELFGYPTTLPWGIPISLANRPPEFAAFTYFHPTFLYESLWDFVGFIVLYMLQQRTVKNGKLNSGAIFFAYLFWVSLGRIVVEVLRIDSVPLIYAWRLPLLISFGVSLATLAYFIRRAFDAKSMKRV